MRHISVLLLVIVLPAMLITACAANNTEITERPDETISSIVSLPASEPPFPAPTPAATSSAVAETDPEIVSVVTQFISAQNTQDWDAFLNLWTNQEQLFYKDFFAYPDNIENHVGYFSIKNAELTGVYDITYLVKDEAAYLDLPYEVGDGVNLELTSRYDDYRVLILKTAYALENEFWDYREGANYRVLVLAAENGQWKVLQDCQGYPGAAVYFNDPLPPEETTSENYAEETNNLVDGTVHFTKKTTGYYIGINIGDYAHPGFKTIEGEELWFWTASGVANYETLHRYRKAEITYENCDSYIAEADRVINMDRIIDITLLD